MSRRFGWVGIVVALVAGAVAPARAAEVTSVEVEIDAFVDVPARRIDGTAEFVLRNPGPDEVGEVRFLLRANDFARPESPEVRRAVAAGGAAALEEIVAGDGFGGIEIQSVRLTETQADLGSSVTIDGSDMRVPLPEPLGAGAEIRLKVHFVTRLPLARFAGHGVAGRQIDAKDWGPSVAGAAAAAGLPKITVRLRIPEEYGIGATGAAAGEPEDLGDGTKRVTLVSEGIDGIEWTAAPHFRDEAREIELPGGRKVALVYVRQPGHGASEAARVLDAAEFGIRFLDERVAPYPRDRVVLAGTAPGVGAIAGAARAGIVRIPVRWAQPAADLRVEETVLAGVAAQYGWSGDGAVPAYLGLVALHEKVPVEAGVGFETGAGLLAAVRGLDRGIGIRVGTRDLVLPVGPVRVDPLDWNLARIVGWRENPLTPLRGWTLLGVDLDPTRLDLPGLRESLRSPSGTEETAAGVRILETVARHVGRDPLLRRLGTARDLRAAVNLIESEGTPSGLAPSRLVEELERSGGRVDYSVESVESLVVPSGAGLEPQERPGDAPSVGEGEGRPRYRNRVVVRRRGDARIPVDVAFRFADGREERVLWDADSTEKAFVVDATTPLASAEIDPERKIAADPNSNNNGKRVTPLCRPVARISGTLLFWIQNVLHALASVG